KGNGMRRFGSGLLAGAITAALAVAAPVIAASGALAADLPVPGPAPVAYHPPAIYDWSGIYFGGQVGVGNMRDTFTQMATTTLFTSGSTDRTDPWSVVGGVEGGV